MPVDVRKLIFTEPELRVDFQNFCRDQNIVNAQASIDHYELSTVKIGDSPDDKLEVKVTFVSPDPNKPIQATLDENQIIEVLITTCKNHSIPLPRKGAKFVKQHKESGLALSMGLSQADLKAAEPI